MKLLENRPHEPRGMLVTSRVNFDAMVHAPLVNHMSQRHGTKSFVFVGRTAIANNWLRWTDGNAVILNDDDLRARATEAEKNWEESQDIARAFEARYRITYMRNILHQDKGIAANYLQHSPGSVFAQQKPEPLPFLVALINTYFQTLEGLLENEPIDLFVMRASGIFNSVGIAIASQRQIPVSWLNHSRVGKQMMWMEGPHHSANLIKQNYMPESSQALPKLSEIAEPSDSQAARQSSHGDDSVAKLALAVLRLTAERVITRSQDLLRRSWPRRLPFYGAVAQAAARWRAASYLCRRAALDRAKLQEGRYVLFVLHLDPEYTSSTLARRFNHTHAIVQQMALSLPVGYTLAVKEHVIGLGNRSISFYEDLGSLPNVAFVDYRLRAVDVAADAAAVATIWGTICLEASLIGVPVICFTQDSEFAVLKNVHTARCPTEIPQVVEAALRIRSHDEILAARREAVRFRQAQMAVSFKLSTLELDEFGNRNRQTFGLPEIELAHAAERLLAVYRAGGGTAEPIR